MSLNDSATYSKLNYYKLIEMLQRQTSLTPDFSLRVSMIYRLIFLNIILFSLTSPLKGQSMDQPFRQPVMEEGDNNIILRLLKIQVSNLDIIGFSGYIKNQNLSIPQFCF